MFSCLSRMNVGIMPPLMNMVMERISVIPFFSTNCGCDSG